jgi:hypothetical protein
MTIDEIYEKANSVNGLEGMTGNERLWESGLMDEFDRAKKNDKQKAHTILKALRFDELSISRIIGITLETLNYPNAWNFPHENSNGLKNENCAALQYSNINEIAMGAPIGGLCELAKKGLDKCVIDKWCGGPAIWNENGLKVAIPIWERSFFKGTFQRIGILDLEKNTLTKYKKKFRILDLRTFKNSMIKGFDSPIHRMKTLEFDIEKETIAMIRKIK